MCQLVDRQAECGDRRVTTINQRGTMAHNVAEVWYIIQEVVTCPINVDPLTPDGSFRLHAEQEGDPGLAGTGTGRVDGKLISVVIDG
jgi:hypothetical protein